MSTRAYPMERRQPDTNRSASSSSFQDSRVSTGSPTDLMSSRTVDSDAPSFKSFKAIRQRSMSLFRSNSGEKRVCSAFDKTPAPPHLFALTPPRPPSPPPPPPTTRRPRSQCQGDSQGPAVQLPSGLEDDTSPPQRSSRRMDSITEAEDERSVASASQRAGSLRFQDVGDSDEESGGENRSETASPKGREAPAAGGDLEATPPMRARTRSGAAAAAAAAATAADTASRLGPVETEETTTMRTRVNSDPEEGTKGHLSGGSPDGAAMLKSDTHTYRDLAPGNSLPRAGSGKYSPGSGSWKRGMIGVSPVLSMRASLKQVKSGLSPPSVHQIDRAISGTVSTISGAVNTAMHAFDQSKSDGGEGVLMFHRMALFTSLTTTTPTTTTPTTTTQPRPPPPPPLLLTPRPLAHQRQALRLWRISFTRPTLSTSFLWRR